MFDECGLELWAEMTIFYLWHCIACPLDDSHWGKNQTSFPGLLRQTLLHWLCWGMPNHSSLTDCECFSERPHGGEPLSHPRRPLLPLHEQKAVFVANAHLLRSARGQARSRRSRRGAPPPDRLPGQLASHGLSREGGPGRLKINLTAWIWNQVKFHSFVCKVCIKSLWTVVWFSQIVYFISDYQHLWKQLPKLVKLQKFYSMMSCLMNVD